MHAHLHCIFLKFPTWVFHSHFVEVRYMTRGPIRRSIVCFSSFSRFLPYINSPPYLCFLFLSGWYTYNKSCIRGDSYISMITRNFFNISVTSEMCSLVSIGVGPLYITSWFSCFWFRFSYFGRNNGSTSFVELFVVEALHENLRMISSLVMFIDLETTFAMLS
jgi:hypothetical protein